MRAKVTLKKPDWETTGWTTITGNVKMGTKYIYASGVLDVPFFENAEYSYSIKILYDDILKIEFE